MVELQVRYRHLVLVLVISQSVHVTDSYMTEQARGENTKYLALTCIHIQHLLLHGVGHIPYGLNHLQADKATAAINEI